MTEVGDSLPGDVENDDPIGRVLAGRYRIVALLGSGGMGAVYRAEHVHMRKAVAVKVLHPEMTQMPEVVARFEREAVAAARITHPNVATATDFGRLDDGSFYLALEFIEGKSLASAIKSEGALGEARALGLARQIADALAAAHAAGVVHRDLKPDNVMLVERNGSDDFVKVLDFGIAKLKLEASSGDQPLTQMGMVFGTPEYMSPEQAQGLDVDARSDLYALGIILYEMLAGHSPFKHEDLVAVLTRQITMEPPPLPASVSKAAAELTFKLLSKSPAERVQSADEVRTRIDAILSAGAFEAAALGAPPSSVTPAATVVTSDPLATSAEAHTELSLPSLTGKPYHTLRAAVRRLGLERRLAIGRYAIPLGAVLGLGALLMVALGLSLTLLLVTGGNGQSDANAAPPRPHDPDVLALVAKAEVGDAAAIAALSARPGEKRSRLEWRAIAHGYCLLSNFAACLRVYSEGVAAHGVMATDPSLLSDVRRLAESPELASEALGFAATALGTAGADLLFDVAEKGKAQSPSVQKARSLLDEEPAKSHVSAALRAQLLLQAAMKKPRCAELKRLLPDLSNDADERAVPLLTRLLDRRGCGFLGLSDCYGCLRTGGDLSRVLEAARGRAKPSFAAAPTPAVQRALPAGSAR